MKISKVGALTACGRLVTALNITDIPQCARKCITTSTIASKGCSVVDIACLCSNSGYVTALSCCLATNCTTAEQAVAIEFNQEECGSVNRTAPGFVGCSPVLSTNTTGGTPTSYTSLVSTITQDPVSEPFSLRNAIPVTATYSGQPLMTGSCTVPYFAMITDPVGMIMEFPLVGCAANRPACCPFDDGQNALITQCPQDYFSTAGGCCPTGFSVYGASLGPETPCYSSASKTFMPLKTSTNPNLMIVTDHVFARRYLLTTAPAASKLSLGALIGIIVNAVVAVLLLLGIGWFLRRRRQNKKQSKVSRGDTFPPEEPILPMQEQKTHELESPATSASVPGSPQTKWTAISPPSSPPSYDAARARPVSIRTTIMQELPGSTFMHEHHPAFVTEVSVGQSISDPVPLTSLISGRSKDEKTGSVVTMPLSTTQPDANAQSSWPLPAADAEKLKEEMKAAGEDRVNHETTVGKIYESTSSRE